MMTRRSDTPETDLSHDVTNRHRFEPGILTNALGAVGAVNEQLLDALVFSARQTQQSFPLTHTLRERFAELTFLERRQVCHCGVLLADMEFSDLPRWQRVTLQGEFEPPLGHSPHWLPGERSVVLSAAVLLVTWHVVHTAPDVASVALGLSEPVLAIFQTLAVSDLAKIAQSRPPWIRPRWVDRPDLWMGLLDAATESDEHLSPGMILRCLKASAVNSTRLMASVIDPR